MGMKAAMGGKGVASGAVVVGTWRALRRDVMVAANVVLPVLDQLLYL